MTYYTDFVEDEIIMIRSPLMTKLLNDIKQEALEFWISYNYEIAQGRKIENNNSFIWLDE